MDRLTLSRKPSSPSGTFGTLQGFVTLELPWKDNHPEVSCIPVGVYEVVWTKSPRLQRFTYEVTGVPGRNGIRFHSANWAHQLLGCIALGKERGVLNGEQAVLQSREALEEFEKTMGYQPFILEIKNDTAA